MRYGCFNEQACQKRLEPESALVFVAMNHFEHFIPCNGRSARAGKMRFQIPTIGAVKGSGDCPLEGQTAALTERRLDATHFQAATPTNETFRRSGSFCAAGLAYLRIQKI